MKQKVLSIEQVEALLENLGLEPEKVLPDLYRYNRQSTEAHIEGVNKFKVEINPAEENSIEMRIRGIYSSAARLGYKERSTGIWRPSLVERRKFDYMKVVPIVRETKG